MALALQLVAGPTVEPIDLVTAKNHLRVDTDDDDALITDMISEAREHVEAMTNRALLTQTWKLVLDRFPPSSGPIQIPRPPLQSVSNVQYTDSANNVVTVSNSVYRVDTATEPGRVQPGYSLFWPPAVLQTIAAVNVTFVAGWTDPSLVPKRAKRAMLLAIGHWYENRQEVLVDKQIKALELPQAAGMLLWQLWAPPAENS